MLDVIGDRWTILILHGLVVEGPRKFQDFERSLHGISPNTLSSRLKRLEEADIVKRRFYEQHPPPRRIPADREGRCFAPSVMRSFRREQSGSNNHPVQLGRKISTRNRPFAQSALAIELIANRHFTSKAIPAPNGSALSGTKPQEATSMTLLFRSPRPHNGASCRDDAASWFLRRVRECSQKHLKGRIVK